MNIVIAEDNLYEMKDLRTLVEHYASVRGLAATIDTFRTADDFIAALDDNHWDLALFDCYLDEAGLAPDPDAKTGLDAARALRERDSDCTIIFTTSSRDFAVESYEVQAQGYLLKPIVYDELSSLLDRVIAQRSPWRKVMLGGDVLDPGTLVWARQAGHYLDLHVTDGKPKRVRATFAQAEGALTGLRQFYSPARGYLVNLDMVERMDGSDLVMRGGERVPVSRRNLARARAAWSNWVAQREGRTI
jgi:DNA-binding LytR/AlgR family response regulator